MSFKTSKRAPRKQTLSVLVCGAAGTGKSSFINTLVGRRVLFESERAPAAYANSLSFHPSTVELDAVTDGAHVSLTLVETEGFGAALDHASDVEKVALYVTQRFDEVLAEETRIHRNPRFKDDRLDVCLYFIEPTGHGLREIDILTLRQLSDLVNIVPVLARSDTLTPAERALNKRLITEDLRFHDIAVFNFQYADEPTEDCERYHVIPFAVMASSEFDEAGRSTNLRRLPYGTVQIMDPHHSDVELLRMALFESFLTEFKDRTHDVLYETYRTQWLNSQKRKDVEYLKKHQSLLLPQELADHSAKLKQEQIEREAVLLHEREQRVNAEIAAKREMLLRRERELRELEQKIAEVRAEAPSHPMAAPSRGYADDVVPAHQLAEPRHDDYASQEANDATAAQAAAAKHRLRQSQSKQELRQHTEQLHAELGDLEAQRQEIHEQLKTSPLKIKKTAGV